MKKCLLLLISMFTILLVGCNPILERDSGCQINASLFFDWNGHKITHSLYIEKENERFVWTCDTPLDKMNYFYFIFSLDDLYLDNSDEFEYITSTNEEILFEFMNDSKEGEYEFTGPITIYIYYANSSSEIKDIINGDIYYIRIAGENWFAEPSLFEK